MESYIVSSQIQDIKGNLVRLIQSQTVNNPELIVFTKVVPVIYLDNQEMLCNIYGIKQGVLQFDSMNSSIDMMDMNLLPVEAVIKVKEHLENHSRAKEYSRQ